MNISHKIVSLALALLSAGAATEAQAQYSVYNFSPTTEKESSVKPFSHLDAAVSVGTHGIGLDLAAPLASWAGVRAGFDFTPHINVDTHFKITTGKIDKDGNYIVTDKFSQMAQLMKEFSGYYVDENVTMHCKPTMNNAKLLVDFMPFRNKGWHITLGAYYGSAHVGSAVNSTEDMPSLVAVGIYNNIYDKLANVNLPSGIRDELYQRMWNSRETWGEKPWLELGDLALNVDPFMSDEELSEYCDNMLGALESGLFKGATTVSQIDEILGMVKKMKGYGRVGVYLGRYTYSEYETDAQGNIVTDANGNPVYKKDASGNPIKEGSPYIMIPNDDAMATAKLKANRFKPYVGFGYGGSISKDGKTRLSFDAGALFWGGVPKVIAHDGTEFTQGLNITHGNVGHYVKIVKKFPVYPMLSVRISRRLF